MHKKNLVSLHIKDRCFLLQESGNFTILKECQLTFLKLHTFISEKQTLQPPFLQFVL